MQRYFVIKSSNDCFVVIDWEDRTIFSSKILKDCLNVQNNLNNSQNKQTLHKESLESILVELVRNQNTDMWRLEPDGFQGASLLDENEKVVVQHVSAEVAVELLRLARKIRYPKDSK